MEIFSLSDGCKIDLDTVNFDPIDVVNKLLGAGASLIALLQFTRFQHSA